MYTANSPKELKKLIEEGKSPIYTTDPKTIKVIEALESLKTKGVVETAKDEIKEVFLKILIGVARPIGLISETTTIILVGMSLATLIALYATYKNRSTKIKYRTDKKGKPEVEIEIE